MREAHEYTRNRQFAKSKLPRIGNLFPMNIRAQSERIYEDSSKTNPKYCQRQFLSIKMVSVLTIGGSDCSGCAGIQADLKSFTMLGLHGSTVIACVTAQNTRTVSDIYALPPALVRKQIGAVLTDLNIKFVKTGMLCNSEIVRLVADRIKYYRLKAVVDPVMASTTKAILLNEENEIFLDSLRRYLIPNAFLITPNLCEAEAITNEKVNNIGGMKRACKSIYELGAGNVLVKGGHLRGSSATDILYDGTMFTEFTAPKRQFVKAHGGGCSYSALITGLLAKNYEPVDAVKTAKKHITKMIFSSYKPGKGADVVRQYSIADDEIERYNVLKKLEAAVDWVERELPVEFVPEVGINFVYALPNACSTEDICGVEGRLVRVGGRAKRVGNIRFGVSRHVANVVLAAMHYDRNILSAMNIRYSSAILDTARSADLKIAYFDRSKEPKNVSTMLWGTELALRKAGSNVPDIIYDKGAVGKEPMIRVLGENPEQIIKKLKLLIKN